MALPAAASAQVDAPWTDVSPTVQEGVVWAAALGAPDERIRRFSARRDSARRMARARAEAALHAWVDEALARVNASPRDAQAVHAAITEHARVRAVRPLVDAGAVIALEVPLAALRRAARLRGVPWG